MPGSIVRPCWHLQVYNPVERMWRIRSSHDTPQRAAEQAKAVQRCDRRARVRVTPGERRVLIPDPPIVSATRRHRETQAERIAVLRQATTYYKSGSNGTEIPQLPKEA